MLLRTEQLVSRFLFNKILLRNNFCHSKPNIPMLELQKQKADLSFEIYLLILKKPKGLDLEKKSLHDMIIEKIYQKSQSQDHNISQQQGGLGTKKSDEGTFKYHIEARQPFIDLFEDGYEIDPKIFSQPRIQAGKIDINGEQQKFIFHPTYLITSQVFQQLHKRRTKIRIMAGHYGISKTVSVCLFWHLAKFIDEYRFQEGVKVSEDMKRVPKLVYWSINPDPNPNPHPNSNQIPNPNPNSNSNDVKKIILDQCPEILRKFNLTDQTQYNWGFFIKEFYQKNYPGTITNIIIDQFNFLAQLGRIYEKEIKDIFDGLKLSEIQSTKLQKIKLFFELKEKIESCIRHFHGVLGLSSMNLENKLFEKQITYTTSTNSMIPHFSWVQYSTEFYQDQSLLQIVDYFMFEMNQRIFKNLENTKVSQEDQKEMKKQCFDELIERMSKEQYFFFTPLDIAQEIINLVQQKKKIKSLDKSVQFLKNGVKKIFQNIVGSSLQKYDLLLKKHFQKLGDQDDNKKRIKLMFSIYNYLKQNIGKRTQENNIGNKAQKQIITEVNEIPAEIIGFTSEEIDKFLDRKLFKYKKGELNIELMIPSKLMLQLIQPCVNKQFNLYLQFTLQQMKIIDNQSLNGQRFESAFLRVLNKGNVKFQFYLKNMIQKGLNNIYKFDINHGIYQFVQLQKRTKKSDSIQVSILDRFKQTIKSMRQKRQEYAVVFPIRKNSKQKQKSKSKSNLQKTMIKNHASNSKMIDMVLIQNDQKSNLISIWIIDVTVSKNRIRPKIYDFISQFLMLKDNKDTKLTVKVKTPDVKPSVELDVKLDIQINYAVFGPQNGIYHDDLQNVLTERFKQQITFKTQTGSNAFTVDKLINSESCLLKRVAYIDLDSDFKFDQQSKKNNEYLPILVEMFQQVLKQHSDENLDKKSDK